MLKHIRLDNLDRDVEVSITIRVRGRATVSGYERCDEGIVGYEIQIDYNQDDVQSEVRRALSETFPSLFSNIPEVACAKGMAACILFPMQFRSGYNPLDDMLKGGGGKSDLKRI